MKEMNERLLSIGRNIFKQIEANKNNNNIIISPEDAKLLFEYIFELEKAYDKLKGEKKEEKENANTESAR